MTRRACGTSPETRMPKRARWHPARGSRRNVEDILFAVVSGGPRGRPGDPIHLLELPLLDTPVQPTTNQGTGRESFGAADSIELAAQLGRNPDRQRVSHVPSL